MYSEKNKQPVLNKEIDKLRIAAQKCVKERDYWQEKIGGQPDSSYFPYDFNRTSDKPVKADSINVIFSDSLNDRLMQVSNHYDYTLYMIMVSGLMALLRKYMPTENIIVGAPIYKQRRKGELINTVLALKDRVIPDMTFKELLLQVKTTIVDADKNKNYPMELLLEHLGMNVSATHFPLFDIVIILENIQDKNDLMHIPVSIRFLFKRTGTAVKGVIEYNTDRYRRTTIERIISHFTRLLERAMANLDIEIGEIDIFTVQEKQQLLIDFNETGGKYPLNTVITELFETQVEKNPDTAAVVQGGDPCEFITYKELNKQANRLAHYLLHQDMAKGEMVGLLAERSLDMIVSILGIMKTGAVYVPLDPKAPISRLAYILAECQIKLVVSTIGVVDGCEYNGETVLIARKNRFRNFPDINPRDNVNPENTAYVIFTSGSTGRPKGVPITHANFSPLIHWGRQEMGFDSSDRIIQNLSYYFDGSVWEIFIALITGAALYTITDEIQLNPPAYLEFIQTNAITAILITPTQYKYLLNAGHMPNSLRCLFIGAEKLSVDLAEESFDSVSQRCRVFNMYGPTEATIISSVLELQKDKLTEFRELSSVPIGRAVGNIKLFILNKDLKLCPIGAEGEIYIAGDALSQGYLNDPEKTATAFIANPYVHTGGERLYKTGDRGRWLEEGIIEFMGRTDQQVKIRGYRIEPGEIETALIRHQSVRDTLVIPRENENGENYLCAYIIPHPDCPDNTPQAPRFKTFLSEQLPDYMVPSYFIMLEHFPLNPNGKVDITALPEPGVEVGNTAYAAPRDKIEKTLTDIWAETLDTETKKIGIDDDFFLLGGHSLKANSAVARIYQLLGVKLPLSLLFEFPTIRDLSRKISEAKKEKYEPIKPVAEMDYYPLSPQQERLYILQQMDPESTGYNLPHALPLKDEVDLDRLENTINTLIRRHENFRTSFHTVGERPVQVVQAEASFSLRYYDLRDIPESSMEDFQRVFIKPFNLSEAPLLRAALIRTGETGDLLMLDLHHIITDGTSQALLTNEFITLYAGKELPEPRIQYKDYTQWINKRLQSESMKRQETFWLHSLSGDLPVLHLPIDYPRPAFQSFEGSRVRFELTGREKENLKKVGQAEGVTLYMILISVFSILLSKLSGDEDIIIGTPIAGRSHPDTQRLLGMLVNTLAMRNYPCGNKSFNQYLIDVKDHTIRAFENQEYQFDRLVEKLSLPRDTSRNPVFDVMFNLLNQEENNAELVLVKDDNESYYKNKTSKFDLNLTAVERGNRLIFDLEYSTKLFKKETIDTFLLYFKRIIAAVTANPEELLGRLELLSPDEKTVILKYSQGPVAEVNDRWTIHKMYEEIAARHPDKTVLVMDQTRVSFKELNRKANCLAQVLKSKGVTAGTVLGLMVERSIAMITGILATLKAGGTCLPIDTDYPEERKRYMVEDSGIKQILVNKDTGEYSHWLPGDVEITDLRDGTSYKGDGDNLDHVTCGDDPLYVIYTSGSTGHPKGVILEHRNLVNLIGYQNRYTDIDFSRVLQFTTISFDVSFQEIFSTLLSGGELHLIDKETRFNIPGLFEVISKGEIRTVFLATGFLKFVFSVDQYTRLFPSCIDHLVAAGEQLVVNDRFKDYLIRNRVQLHNHYGPSETHVVTALTLDPSGDIPLLPTIGCPVTNTGIYIIDNYGNLIPQGAIGELVIGGMQVGRGYLNKPDLTKYRFVNYNWSQNSNRFYKTGDLARYLPDGNIQFLGRKDHQVKIRGFRIELGEIESQLINRDEVKEAVVLVLEKEDGEKYLCAYIVTDSADTDELREYLSKKLPEYMVPAFFVILEKIPLTPNGKLDRKALPLPDPNDTTQSYSPPRNPIEQTLVDIWSQSLGLKKENIGIDGHFFHLGGHSLKATIAAAKIHKELGVKIPLAELFKQPTIRELAKYVGTLGISKHTAINPVEQREYYPMSSAQSRLFFLQQMDLANSSYNISSVLQLEGNLDTKLLEKTFKQLISRHEMLHTSFQMVDEQPVQRIRSEEKYHFKIKIFQRVVNDKSRITKLLKRFIAPFDLSIAPLMRVGLVEIEKAKNLLIIDLHHIISDGISIGVMVKEFMELYNGKQLPHLDIQYTSFAAWQKQAQGKSKLKQQEEFWLNQFDGEIPVLNLPCDYMRPSVKEFVGKTLWFELGAENARALQTMASVNGMTLFMVLLSIYNVLLSKLSGQEDIVVGAPVSGREHEDLQPVIGMFVNTLALRSFPARDKTFSSFLAEVKELTLASFDNQDYQYEELVEKVAVNRDTGRNPLFDAMLILQNMEIPELEIPGLKLKPYHYEGNTAKFDLTLACSEQAGNLFCILEYSTSLFKADTIVRFSQYLKQLIVSVLQNPDRKIAELGIIPGNEKEELLIQFNNTVTDYPKDKTIHRLFEKQVKRAGDRCSVISGHCQVTYGELDRRADRLAIVLKQKGIGPGSIVAIRVERSVELIIGIFGILKSGAAYLPIDPNHPKERFNYMLADSQAALIITGTDITDSHHSIAKVHSTIPETVPSSLAYIIYTSGSTGRPKGVVISHRSVVNFINGIALLIPFGERDVILSLTTISFDIFGLETLLPLAVGSRVMVGGVVEQLDATVAADLLVREHVTIFQLTPSRLQLILEDRTAAAKLRVLDHLLVGGEALSEPLLEKTRRLVRGKIYNMYGPTETTIWSTVKDVTRGNLNIGSPIANTQIYILDKEGHLQPIGVVGELCIAGDGLSPGYLNRPGLTNEKFIYRKSSSVSGKLSTDDRIYKTGDLARWLPNGNIQCLGRIDHQVKIRGFRIELGEIENRLQSHPEISEVAVDIKDDNFGDKALCAYIVCRSKETQPSFAQLKEYLDEKLPDYMVPDHFVLMDNIPLNTNGKVDRKALPDPGISENDTSGYMEPRDWLEDKVVAVYADVLGIVKETIGINMDFFGIGGHSLKATRLVSRLNKELKVKIPLIKVFQNRTPKKMAKYLRECNIDDYFSLPPVENRSHYSLSSAQMRLYILDKMKSGSVVYNIPGVFTVDGPLDREKILEVFQRLIHRHESLRTRFEIVNEEPVQRILSSLTFSIESYVVPADGTVKGIIGSFIRPFNLEKAPLLRAGLVRIEDEKHLIMVDMHHIISDGTSLGILIKEFTAIYNNETLPRLPIQYKDFAAWQNSVEGRKTLNQQKSFWLKEFAGEIPVLELPTDYARPNTQSFDGSSLNFKLTEQTTRQLNQMALKNRVSLYTVLLTIYNVFLLKVTNREAIVVGCPAAGRRHIDLESIIGMFVNTLALKNYPRGEYTFSEFLQQVHTSNTDALNNQDFPYEELVELLAVNRDASRNPLFDTMLILQNMDSVDFNIPGLKIKPYHYESAVTKFDLTLRVSEMGQNVAISMEYSTRLFKRETIDRFSAYFRVIASRLPETPGVKLVDIEIIPQAEKQQILVDFNATEREYPCDKTLAELFESQVLKTPDNIALEYRDILLSYSHLNTKSDHLASWLIEKGAAPGTIIALEAKRSPEMITGILSILKTGAAYLPIDPDYPEDRIQYMIKDSNAALLLTSDQLSGMNLDRTQHQTLLKPKGNPSNPAYIIYTSGSTGKPKGVLVENGSVVNLVYNQKREFDLNFSERILQFSTICFDASVEQIFIALLSGAILTLVDKAMLLESDLFESFIATKCITHMHTVPSFLETIHLKERYSLRRIASGGDVCPVSLAKKWSRYCKFYNKYGPTETTVTSLEMHYNNPTEFSEALTRLTIGRPIDNTLVYILDLWLKAVPIGVAGELFIGGDGTARGYLNQPEVTAEKFITESIPGDQCSLTETRLYKTGDLCRWLPIGEMEFLGRIDQQAKIRGFRIEPGEIESRLSVHQKVKEAVVLVRSDQTNEKYLCAYIVPEGQIPIAELEEFLAQDLPAYMLPAFFIMLEEIPLTPNGKINRKALPEPEFNLEEFGTAPRNGIEKKLAEMWSQILGIEEYMIDIDTDFFSLGGHSLRATVLMARIHKVFSVRISLAEIFQNQTIRGQAGLINQLAKNAYTAIDPAEEKEYYRLSSAQERLYILSEIGNIGTVYNLPAAWIVQGEIDREKLNRAFQALIDRHESLRTSFHLVNGKPVQVVHKETALDIRSIIPGPACQKEEEVINRAIEEFVTVFDLSKAPLMRAALLRLANRRHLLLFDMHHIVTDGVSHGILINEFMALYQEETLRPLVVQYKDFSEWQTLGAGRQIQQLQENYWLDVFGDGVPLLEMPTDHPRPKVLSHAGKYHLSRIDDTLSSQLKQLADKTGTTLNILLLAVFSILLSKYSGQEDIVVGQGIAGRTHPDLEGVIGFFVNVLAIRIRLDDNESFGIFLENVKKTVFTGYENQDYQINDLVSKLNIPNDLSRNPLFNVSFVVQNMDIDELEVSDFIMSPVPVKRNKSRFDLQMEAAETKDSIVLGLEYSTELFEHTTIEKFADRYIEVLRQVVDNVDIPIGKIAITLELAASQSNLLQAEDTEFNF